MVGEILAAGVVAVAVLLAEQRLQNLPSVDSQINFVNRVWRRLIFELSGTMSHLSRSELSERTRLEIGDFFGRMAIVLIIISPFGLMAAAISGHRDQELQRVERDLENIKRAREDLDRHHSKMISQMAVVIDEICRDFECQPIPAAIQQSVIETRLNEHRIRGRKNDFGSE